MYFWNVRALAEDLKLGQVTQEEKMKYFLVQTVIISLVFSFISHLASPLYSTGAMAFLESTMDLVVNVLGIWMCYEANKLGDNKEFLDRIICLSLPIGVRLTVFIIPLSFLIGIMTGWLDTAGAAQDLLNLVLGSGSLLIFYIWVRSYILDISGAKNHGTLTNPPSM